MHFLTLCQTVSDGSPAADFWIFRPIPLLYVSVSMTCNDAFVTVFLQYILGSDTLIPQHCSFCSQLFLIFGVYPASM